MAIRAKGQGWQFATLLVVALLLWGIERWKPGLLRDFWKESPGDSSARVGNFEQIDGCRWIGHDRNDGDSFKVRLPDGRIEELRLYFVDAPESEFRTYGGGRTNRERIAEQASDLGVTAEEAVEIGRLAKAEVEEWLSQDPFTVFTEWDDPFGDRRFHAFVVCPDGEWLHERLVREGLVRIHTKGASVPGQRSEREQESRLGRLQEIARQSRKGVWAMSSLAR
ncbi:hypothetical protein HAHE_10710 [Haloferula helveola]|uniref:TNase-like domain-containing protein n=1 Tax=Haloferula helveola TaxID=490095 RepID=A0ABM7RAE4_9BACT|nr:hypothetical protein HAHE_10710 [Haloferula helveola]